METRLLLNFNKIKKVTTDPAFLINALVKFENSSMCTYKLIKGGLRICKKSLYLEEN